MLVAAAAKVFPVEMHYWWARLVDGRGGPDAANDAGDEAYVEIEHTEHVGGPPEISAGLLSVAILATARWTSSPPGVRRTSARTDQRPGPKRTWNPRVPMGLGHPKEAPDVPGGADPPPLPRQPPSVTATTSETRSRSNHLSQDPRDAAAGRQGPLQIRWEIEVGKLLAVSFRFASSASSAVVVDHSAASLQMKKAGAFHCPSFEGDLPTRMCCERQRLLATSIAVDSQLAGASSLAQFRCQALDSRRLPWKT